MYAHLQEPPPSVTADRTRAAARDRRRHRGGRWPRRRTIGRRRGGVSSTRPRERSTSEARRTTDGSSSVRTRLRRLVPVIAVATALVVGIVVSSALPRTTHRGRARRADSRPRPTTSPSPTPAPAFRTVDRALSEDEQRLLTYLPEDVKRRLPARSTVTRTRPGRARRPRVSMPDPTSRCCTSSSRRGTTWTHAFQATRTTGKRPHGECATDHRGGVTYSIGGEPAGRVLCYTVEPPRTQPARPRSRTGPISNGRTTTAPSTRMRSGTTSRTSACTTGGSRRPARSCRRATRRRPKRPAGLARTSTPRRVLPDFAHGTPGEPFRLLGPVPPRGDVGCPSSRRHL